MVELLLHLLMGRQKGAMQQNLLQLGKQRFL
jgi:hypothetical protein